MKVSNFDAPRMGLFCCRTEAGRRLVRTLIGAGALAVGLSVLLFLCILLAWKLGWVQPTGLPIKP